MLNGTETLTIKVGWVDGHRTGVEVRKDGELLVAGGSANDANDAMSAIGRFFGYAVELVGVEDGTAVWLTQKS
jgi:hypothetical protein